jgi:serine/threonine-protein kinase
MSRAQAWQNQELANGRYRLLDVLGEGGMGIVYLAEDRNLNCTVVIKAPKFSHIGDDQALGRFAREVRSLVQFVHAHIVRILDVGEHDHLPFAVMEYLPGGSLKTRGGPGTENQPQSPESLRDWLPAIAEALDFIHAQNYLHRDIKPDNILFDASGKAKLSDFGIAKGLQAVTGRRETVLTGPGLGIGTPGYMAPEMLRAEPLDPRADQYSLAITVYEALAGQGPYEGLSLGAMVAQQMASLPRPLEEVVAGIPAGLAEAVQSALALHPNDRYSSCGEFAQAVLDALPRGRGAVPSGTRKGRSQPPPLPGTAVVAPTLPVKTPEPGGWTPSRPAKTTPSPIPLLEPDPRPAPAPVARTVAVARPRASKTVLPPPPPAAPRRRRSGQGGSYFLWAMAAFLGVAILCAILIVGLIVRPPGSRKSTQAAPSVGRNG